MAVLRALSHARLQPRNDDNDVTDDMQPETEGSD
jgi:hypothetical protein